MHSFTLGLCLCTHIYIKPALLIEGFIRNVVVFPLFSKWFESSKEFSIPAIKSVPPGQRGNQGIWLFRISDFRFLVPEKHLQQLVLWLCFKFRVCFGGILMILIWQCWGEIFSFMDEKEERFSQPNLLLEVGNYCGLSRKTLLSLMTCMYHYQFCILCFMWAGLEARAARSWFADPAAQILGGLRQKQKTITRRVLLCSQEVTFGKSWNSLTQFLGPQQGFCQIRATWDLLPWWSCSGAPRNHPCDLPAYLENASCKTLSTFCWMIEQILFHKALPFGLMGRGDSYFSSFYLLI